LFFLNSKNYSLQHCHGAGAGMDPDFVEYDTIFGILFKKKNAKLQIQN
jgi:hypothetical protein